MAKGAFAELSTHQQLLRSAAIDGAARKNAAPCPATEQLGRVVARVGAFMRARFAREEAPGGYFAFVCTAAPRYLTMIDTLRAEHDAIAARLSLLETRTAARAGDWDALLAELKSIIAAIREHEALEREMLRDALENDPSWVESKLE